MGTVWAAADISEKNTNVFHESLIKTNLNVSLASHQVTLDFLSSCLTSVCVWAVSPAGPVCVSVPLNSPQSPVVSRSASPAESTGCSADEPPQQTNKQTKTRSVSLIMTPQTRTVCPLQRTSVTCLCLHYRLTSRTCSAELSTKTWSQKWSNESFLIQKNTKTMNLQSEMFKSISVFIWSKSCWIIEFLC